MGLEEDLFYDFNLENEFIKEFSIIFEPGGRYYELKKNDSFRCKIYREEYIDIDASGVFVIPNENTMTIMINDISFEGRVQIYLNDIIIDDFTL